jgi:integrase
MIKPKSKKKTRSDKFPLTLHPTGQFCKKIRGKLYYFGTDKKEALRRYLEQAAYLHNGKHIKTESVSKGLDMKTLCNMYLDHQESRAAVGEVRLRQVYDQTMLLRDFVRFVGPNRISSDVATIDLQDYRSKLIRIRKSPHTINNRIAAVKAMFNWALDNEIIETSPRLNAIKKVPRKKDEKPTFTTAQVQNLLKYADKQMKAMIWLGLNCGFGCTDCAELKWTNVDLKSARVHFPRGKTGVGRNSPLWPETVQAINEVAKSGELVFYTPRGHPCVRGLQGATGDGNNKYNSSNAISRRFSSLLKKAGIKVEKGVGFYTLRRTAATLAAKSGDHFAVQKLLGHADVKMASTYVQNISEQTDRVVNGTRKLIVQDNSSPSTDDADGNEISW